MTDIRRFHELFYKEPNRQYQNDVILKYVRVQRPGKIGSSKEQLTTYFIPAKTDQKVTLKKVCRTLFLATLGIKKDRLTRLCQHFLKCGNSPKETRGGDSRSANFEEKRKSVKSFIESLTSVESHYVRNKNVTRFYLSSDLTIAKLYNIYLSTVTNKDLLVNYHYFYNIFVKDYNISTKSPATDVCSTCLSLGEEIKRTELVQDKTILKVRLDVHKAKAAWFYRLLKTEEDETIVLSFDCQKNLSLPKIPDQSVYYARQICLYNLTVCIGTSTSQRTLDNTFSYVWVEDEFPKSSNEVSSAIYDILDRLDLHEKKLVRLFADGCGGQNKNSILITMLLQWMSKQDDPPQIEAIFPVVGHSFMPPDRIFGLIERKIRKLTNILTPEEYLRIINKYSTVRRLGIDCKVFNFKKKCEEVVKKPGNWHFPFMKSKRYILNKVTNKKGKASYTVRGEITYGLDIGKGLPVQKKGKNFGTVEDVKKGVYLKKEKLADVQRLLIKHFGESWRNDNSLEYYVRLIDRQTNDTDGSNNLTGTEDDLGDIIIEKEDEEISIAVEVTNEEDVLFSVAENEEIILIAERDKNNFI